MVATMRKKERFLLPMRVSLSLTDIGTLLLVSYKVVAQGQGECLATCTTGPETRHQPFGRGITDRVPTRPQTEEDQRFFLRFCRSVFFFFVADLPLPELRANRASRHAGESAHTGQPTHPERPPMPGSPPYRAYRPFPHPFGQRRHFRPCRPWLWGSSPAASSDASG